MKSSFIFLFNVGRGLSLFILLPNKNAIIYDLGCSTDFSPIDFISNNFLSKLIKIEDYKISQIIISHPHGDHISEISKIYDDLLPKLITCPHSKSEKEKVYWNRINNRDIDKNNIEIYKNIIKERSLPLQTIIFNENFPELKNIDYGIYYFRPPYVNIIHPNNDQEYSNGISIIMYYKHDDNCILIPGDITPAVLEAIINEDEGLEKRYTIFNKDLYNDDDNWNIETNSQPSLKSILKNNKLTILVAPHHGLKSGFCQELYDNLKNKKPELVVISEKRHNSVSDGETEPIYQSDKGSSKLKVEIDDNEEERNSVSTKNGHHILIEFKDSGGIKVRLNKKIDNLLKYVLAGLN